MDRRVIFILSLVIAITGVLMGVKGLSRPHNVANAGTTLSIGSQSPVSSAPAETPAQEPAAPRIGSLAPDFTLKSVPGLKPVRLSSLRGKAVLVNFWATWCEPCKLEMPWLVDLQKKYGPQGLQILGVAMDDADNATINGFAHKMGVNYPVLKGTEKVAGIYGGLDGLPTSFFVDRSGKVVDTAIGLVSQSVIEEAIKKSLEQGNEAKASHPE